MSLNLTARLPFSLAAVVDSHGWRSLAPFSWAAEAGVLSYVDRLTSGQAIEVVIRESAAGVAVDHSPDLDAADRDEVAARVTWMLGLDQDLTPFYALTGSEPKLARAEARAQGRVLRSPTLWEDTVKTILTTNTAWSGTTRMVGALVSHLGSPLRSDPTRHAFPTPQQVAAADEDTLRSIVRLGYRAPYVLALAQSVASGDLDLEAIRTSNLPTPELRKELLAIKGVGAYAAANLLVLLGRYDFLPVDSWALKMVSHEFYGGEPAGAGEVEAAFEPWGAWKGLAYWFWDWSYWDEDQKAEGQPV